MKIFIIHARRTGYGVVRSLKDFTRDIYVADNEETPVFHSRHVKQGFVISDINKVSNDEFLEEVITLAKAMEYEKERPIVFTGKDDYLQFFSRNSEVLSPYFLLSFEANAKVLESALSKKELIKLAKHANVLIPKSYTDDDLIAEAGRQLTFPVIIKPAVKNTPEKDIVSEAFRLKVCESPAALDDAIAELVVLDVPYIVQELIPGGDSELYTMAIYSWKGRVKAWSLSKKIRQFPPTVGECSYGKTLYDSSILEATTRLMETTGLTGISQVEYKKCGNDYYLIEINPRVWSWHQIHSKVGVNLCKIACDHALGQVSGGVIHPEKGEKYWMFFMMDVLHNRLLNRNVSWVALLRDFLTCDIEAFFSWSDPKPFLVHFLETMKYIKRLRQKQIFQSVTEIIEKESNNGLKGGHSIG